MIHCQIKLRLTVKQEAKLNAWLWHLAGVYNWAVRKIEQDAKGGIYYHPAGFSNLLAGHSARLGVPSHTIQEVLSTVCVSWRRCFKKLGGRPKMKSRRNRMSSIPFPDPIRAPTKNRITIPGLKSVKFHNRDIPSGKIKCGRIIKCASGWHLCLFIDAEPNVIERKAEGEVGIDPGFKDLVTLSSGEKIVHPRELEASSLRLAQAQRGRDIKLAARIQERIANQRKDRNHKLSHRLVSENTLVVFSKDNHKAISKKFGKSVSSSSHGQLRSMISYKSRIGGSEYIEVNPAFSTKTCSACGCPSGPSGLAGLKVRQWECVECGTSHDRDINAAINTLIAGAGEAHESGKFRARNYSNSQSPKRLCI